jgi:hypothetical protein
MFWKEKRVERKLEREIGRKERELAGSTDPMQRGSLLEELVWLKEERGDLFGAISALLDKFKEDRKVDTLKKLRPILEKHSEFDLRELEEGSSSRAKISIVHRKTIYWKRFTISTESWLFDFR